MRSIIVEAIGWALLALCTAATAAEDTHLYRPPRLPDGHVDMQGMWKNSNLTPLERARGFTQLRITAADAERLRAEFVNPPGGVNVPDDPGRELDRTFEPIRSEFRSSLIIDPDDGKIPWREIYKEKPTALRRAVLTAFDNPEQRPPLERCLGSTAAPPMQAGADNSLYQIVQTPATIVINDPTYYTRPWTAETHWMHSNGRMFEVACHEGNYSMRGMLEAARSHELEEAGTQASAKPN
jgi:hypothetical protein